MNYTEKLKDPRWLTVKLKIQNRDANKCRKCESTENLNVHHIIYFPFREPWEYDNEFLITLCSACHLDTEAIIERIKYLLCVIQQQNIWRIDNIRVLLERELNEKNFIKYTSIKHKHG